MAVNKIAGECRFCRGRVPANGGRLERIGRWPFRWVVSHLACRESNSPRVTSFMDVAGGAMHQNVDGRCEDAPCCGCCS